MSDLLTISYQSENAQRAYPFADRQTDNSDYPVTTLPFGTILDQQVSLFREADSVVFKGVVSTTSKTVTLRFDLLQAEVVRTYTAVVQKEQILDTISSTSGHFGTTIDGAMTIKLVFGPACRTLFSPFTVSLPLLPCQVVPKPPGVNTAVFSDMVQGGTSVSQPNGTTALELSFFDERQGTPLGHNVSSSFNPPLTLDVRAGQGAGLLNLCDETSAVYSINNTKPDSSGNLNLTVDACYVTLPFASSGQDTDGLLLGNLCQEGCNPSDLDAIQRYINRLKKAVVARSVPESQEPRQWYIQDAMRVIHNKLLSINAADRIVDVKAATSWLHSDVQVDDVPTHVATCAVTFMLNSELDAPKATLRVQTDASIESFSCDGGQLTRLDDQTFEVTLSYRQSVVQNFKFAATAQTQVSMSVEFDGAVVLDSEEALPTPAQLLQHDIVYVQSSFPVTLKQDAGYIIREVDTSQFTTSHDGTTVVVSANKAGGTYGLTTGSIVVTSHSASLSKDKRTVYQLQLGNAPVASRTFAPVRLTNGLATVSAAQFLLQAPSTRLSCPVVKTNVTPYGYTTLHLPFSYECKDQTGTFSSTVNTTLVVEVLGVAVAPDASLSPVTLPQGSYMHQANGWVMNHQVVSPNTSLSFSCTPPVHFSVYGPQIYFSAVPLQAVPVGGVTVTRVESFTDRNGNKSVVQVVTQSIILE